MLIAPSISSTAGHGGGPGFPSVERPASEPVAHHNGLENDTEGGVAALAAAFDLLLEATRTRLDGPPRHADQASPSQMFEPNTGDARRHRAAVLQAQDRAERLSPPRDGRLDTTSIDARRSGQAGKNTGVFSSRATAGQPASWVGAPCASGSAAGRPASLAVDEGGGRCAAMATAAADFDGKSNPAKAASGPVDVEARFPSSAPAVGLEMRAAAGPVSSSVASAAAISPTASGAQGASLARQVEQLLSTANAGQTESARAIGSSPAVDGGRWSMAQPNNAQSRSQGQPAEANRSTSQAGERAGWKTGSPGVEQSEFDRLIRSIRLRTGGRNSTARLQLEPPELGRIRVDVRMAGEKIRIDVRTETPEARELLHDRAAQLRASLEQHGIHLDRFNVTTQTAGHESGSRATSDGSQSAADQHGNNHGAAEPAPTDTPASDYSGDSDAVDLEPEPTADAEARLDIRI